MHKQPRINQPDRPSHGIARPGQRGRRLDQSLALPIGPSTGCPATAESTLLPRQTSNSRADRLSAAPPSYSAVDVEMKTGSGGCPAGFQTVVDRLRLDGGQATAEYALVMLAAAGLAGMVLAWAVGGNGVERLMNAVLDSIIAQVAP